MLRIRDLVANQAAERADAFADDEARRAAQLLADTVRNLRQVVEVETQVVGQRACLAAQVLDYLQVVGLVLLARERRVHRARARAARRRSGVSYRRAIRGGRAGPRWSATLPDSPSRPRLRVAAVAVRVLLALGSGDDERVRLEHPQADFVCRGILAICALVRSLAAVLRRPMKPLLLELAIDHDRDPPSGDAVLAQLEQSTWHAVRP